jgi:hypothetical protein
MTLCLFDLEGLNTGSRGWWPCPRFHAAAFGIKAEAMICAGHLIVGERSIGEWKILVPALIPKCDRLTILFAEKHQTQLPRITGKEVVAHLLLIRDCQPNQLLT